MNIRVDLNYAIKDGMDLVFRSPVDCSQITGLIVYYKENGNTYSKEFALADAHGNNVGDIDHLFAENVVVKVILDMATSMAFVQNADTNAYLEQRFTDMEENISPIVCNVSGEVVSVSDASDKKLRGLTLYGKSVQNGTPTPDAPVPIVSAGQSGKINVYAINDIVSMPVVTSCIYPLTALVGDYVSFSVTAIGNNLSYQWQFRSTATSQTWNNSTSATQGYNTDTITLKATEERNGRPFRCVITDANGNVTYSEIMTLTLGEKTAHIEVDYLDTYPVSIPTPDGLPGLPVSISTGGNYTDENGQLWISDIKGVTQDIQSVKALEFSADMNWEESASVYTAEDGTTLYRYVVKNKTKDFDYVAGITKQTWRMKFSHGVYRGTNTTADAATVAPLKEGDVFAYTSAAGDSSWVGFLTTIDNMVDFKAWLTAQKEAGTPPTIVYKLKVPIVTEHDPIELPNTYKPNTTIVNDAGAGMALEYVADTKTYIDNKFTELAAAIVSNV